MYIILSIRTIVLIFIVMYATFFAHVPFRLLQVFPVELNNPVVEPNYPASIT